MQSQDTDAFHAKLSSDGWKRIAHAGFPELIGPFWELDADGERRIGFLAEPKHHNRAGFVQGGMLATLADLGLGRAARLDIPGRRQATIQISVQYIDAARIGEFLVARCRKLKETRNLVFVAGEIEADGRLVASVSGIWKILHGKRQEETGFHY